MNIAVTFLAFFLNLGLGISNFYSNRPAMATFNFSVAAIVAVALLIMIFV